MNLPVVLESVDFAVLHKRFLDQGEVGVVGSIPLPELVACTPVLIEIMLDDI